jgi:hypothetical protein
MMGAREVPGNAWRTSDAGHRCSLRRLLLRRIWLPRPLYDAVPALYLTAGTTSLYSALYMTGWRWILPYLLLFGIACLHVSIVLARLRRRRTPQP